MIERLIVRAGSAVVVRGRGPTVLVAAAVLASLTVASFAGVETARATLAGLDVVVGILACPAFVFSLYLDRHGRA